MGLLESASALEELRDLQRKVITSSYDVADLGAIAKDALKSGTRRECWKVTS